MQVSEARLTANRLNSLKSSGPRSPETKAISRRNSLKSGLTGSGAVVSDSDADEIQARAEALTADLKPQSAAGSILIVKMATLSVRMERAAEQESAHIALKVRHAADDFDDERLEQVNALFESLADDPHGPLIKLKRSPEGLEKLIRTWEELRVDLTLGAWTDERLEQAANLIGWKARHALGTRFGALTRAIRGDFAGLSKTDGGGLGDEPRKAWAKDRLAEAIEAEIAALEALSQTIDLETLALDRDEAGQRALFDHSKPASLARRYESEARRGFLRALKEFRQVEAEFAAQSAPVAPASPSSRPDPRMASSREIPPPPPRPYAYPAPTEDFFALTDDGELLAYIPPVKNPG
jgi:hypothetical protein